MKIKVNAHILVIALVALALSLVMPACNKTGTSSNITPGSSTVTYVLQNATDATQFLGALERLHLDTLLAGTGPFTVFVPTDAAFTASGISASYLAGLSDSSLKKLILYHVIAGEALASSGFPSEPNSKIIVATGDSVFVTRNSSGSFVNGVPILNADIFASNGIIDAMSGVLVPPTGDIIQTISTDTSFSYLTTAIARASQGATNLGNMLSAGGGGPYTLLAPINNGFRAAGFASTDDINNADPDSLAHILLYHIIPSRIFTSDIVNNGTSATLGDSTVLFNLGGSTLQVKGTANITPSNILRVNIMATNGVVFVIDQLLQQ